MGGSYHQNSSIHDGTDTTIGSFEFRIENVTSAWFILRSEEHYVGGFLWTVITSRLPVGEFEDFDCILECSPCDRNTIDWSCTAKGKLSIIGTKDCERESIHTFSNCGVINFTYFIPWCKVLVPANGISNNGVITVRVDIEVTSSRGGSAPKCRLSMFDKASSHSDVVLMVEGKNIHASKSTLAMYSTFFDTLFFGEFNEKGKAEVTLGEDIHYDEFIDFLKVIYPERKKVNEDNVGHLLKLADRFDSLEVRRKCEKFLLSTDTVAISKKLLYSYRYHLTALFEKFLNSLTSSSSILELVDSTDFTEYPESLSVILLKRAAALRTKQPKRRFPSHFNAKFR